MHTNVSSAPGPRRPPRARGAAPASGRAPRARVATRSGRRVFLDRLPATVLRVTAVVAVLAPAAQAQVAPREGDLVILGGRLWDGTTDAARPNPGILIRNGTIMRVGPVDPMVVRVMITK